MVALSLDDNKTNDDHDGKENGKKYYDMKLSNFTRAQTFSLSFS